MSLINADLDDCTEESVRANNVPIAPREVFKFQKNYSESDIKKKSNQSHDWVSMQKNSAI